jgi:protein TonB
VVHVLVAGGLLASANTGKLRRPTAVTMLSEPKPRPKPEAPKPRPKPAAPPKAEVKPTDAKVAAPAPAAAAPTAFAALASLEMSNDDVGPGAITVPVPRAASAVKVASLGPRPSLRERELGPAVCDQPPSKPKPVYQVEIEYLAAARAEGVEGRLVLRIFVAADGSVAKVDIVSSVEPRLDAAAVAAVKQWRFEPALACGRPIDGGVYTIARKFELGD